jgi:hypothetical protein
MSWCVATKWVLSDCDAAVISIVYLYSVDEHGYQSSMKDHGSFSKFQLGLRHSASLSETFQGIEHRFPKSNPHASRRMSRSLVCPKTTDETKFRRGVRVAAVSDYSSPFLTNVVLRLCWDSWAGSSWKTPDHSAEVLSLLDPRGCRANTTKISQIRGSEDLKVSACDPLKIATDREAVGSGTRIRVSNK